MSSEDRLILARKIAAAACQLNGNSDEYCQYMRDGAYDDSEVVLAALGGILTTEKNAVRKANVVELAA